MTHRMLLIEGVRVPRFLYGTAWKEDRTEGDQTLARALGLGQFAHATVGAPNWIVGDLAHRLGGHLSWVARDAGAATASAPTQKPVASNRGAAKECTSAS